MKKLLGILVLGLLFCSDGFAGKTVNLPKDVASGNTYKKSLEGKYKKYGLVHLIIFFLEIFESQLIGF